jgi:hypothetical protein
MNFIEAVKLIKEKNVAAYRTTEPGISMRVLLRQETMKLNGKIIEYAREVIVYADNDKTYQELELDCPEIIYNPEIDDVLAEDWEELK